MERDDITNKVVADKVEHLVALINSELKPFINSQLVQQHRQVNVKSVETDKEPFTLPVNIGMYAWDKTASINNTSVHNINFTPGVGLTLPFNNKSQLTSRSRVFDSFGFSAGGVLLKPVVDNNGIEYLTPGVNLPIYTGLGFRVFEVIRFNAGALILGEEGSQGFDNLSVILTAGLALELNLWMGIKKIRGFVIVSAIALTLFSCRVQTPTYVGLYVDNSIPYSDSTTYIGEVPLDIVDTTTVVEAEPKSDLYPAKEMIILSSDSVYQHEVKSLLKWITDSVQPLRHKVFELQKQLAGIPDTSITREKQQVFQKADSLQKEPDFKQLVQKKNDTITMLAKSGK